jgi:hypothetical protein
MRTFAALDMVKGWLRTRLGRGRGLFRTGRGRGLDNASASKPPMARILARTNRGDCADAESFAGEGVRLVRVKSLQVKTTKGDKCAMSKGVTLRQIHQRILPHFDSAANAARFVGRMAKGMVSSFFRLRMKARQPRGIRLDRLLADVPLTSWLVAWGRARESEA